MERKISNSEKSILSALYSGGLQKYFLRNEAQIYMNNWVLDVSNYCLRDFSNSDLSQEEQDCARSLSEKNFTLLKSWN